MHRRARAAAAPRRQRARVERDREAVDPLHHLQRAAGNQAVQRLVGELSVARFSDDEATQLPPGQAPAPAAQPGLQEGEQQQAPPQEQPQIEEDDALPASNLQHHLVSWAWSGRSATSINARGGLDQDIVDRLNELGSRFAPEPLKADEVDVREGQLSLDFIRGSGEPDGDVTVNPAPERVFALPRNRWGLRVLLAQDPGEDAPTPPPGEQTEEHRSDREPGGGPLPAEPDETELPTR